MVIVVVGLLAFVVFVWRRWRRNRRPVGTVTLDRLGPERAMFIRLPTRRNTIRRRYRS